MTGRLTPALFVLSTVAVARAALRPISLPWLEFGKERGNAMRPPARQRRWSTPRLIGRKGRRSTRVDAHVRRRALRSSR